MDVELSDEQQFLREAVAGVVAREAGFTRVRAWADAGTTAAADELAVRQGWTGIGLDEELGGQGGGVLELAVLAEALGSGAVPWDRTLAGCLAAPLLAAAGDEARELAAATAEGERSAVLCVDGRAPLRALCTSDPTHHEVRYGVGAPSADVLVVPVFTPDGIELLAVPGDGPGVQREPHRLVDRTRSVADVHIDGASLHSLGSIPPEAFARAAAAAAVLVAADALGAAGKLLELTVAYVAERRQFGVAVGSFQAVKHAAAEMLVDVEASRSAVHYAAWAVDADDAGLGMYAAVAKAYASAAAVRVADKALFLHGAIGYTWEHDLQFLFKRAKSDALLFGSADAYRDRIADGLELVRAVETLT